MIYGVILTIALGVLGYIQYLKNLIQKREQESAVLRSQVKNSEWDKQIKESNLKITEDIKDFKDAEKDFHDKYGSGDSQSGKPSQG